MWLRDDDVVVRGLATVATIGDVISAPSAATGADDFPTPSPSISADNFISVSLLSVRSGGEVVFAYEVRSGASASIVLRLTVCGIALESSGVWQVK